MGFPRSGRRTAPAAMKVSAASLRPLYVFTAVCLATATSQGEDNSCNPSPCGENADCVVRNGTPVCICPSGYTGNPFTRCVPDQNDDPCRPSPCGPNTQCNNKGGQAVCSCLPGFFGNPLTACKANQKGCLKSSECRPEEACIKQECGNPCHGICGQQAECKVINHNPICNCPFRYTGDPFVRCTPAVIEGGESCSFTSECATSKACNKITSKCEEVCVANFCGENANCHADNHVPICNCIPGYTGDPKTRCYPMQVSGKCPPLADPSRDISCVFQGRDADCKSQMAPGTKASVMCKPHYENVPELRSYDTTCKANGKWSRELQACVPKCGEQNAHGVALVAHGERSKIAEYPWHVALYKSNPEGQFELQCGGTLVSTRVVVTAAHCFPEDSSTRMKQVLSQFRAVAGKYKRDWNENNKYTQHLEIEKIVQHSQYRGQSRNYVDDIAVIVLKYHVRIDEAVRPVCVDYDKSYRRYFSPDIVGRIIGFGNTENQELSDVLMTGSLPYVNQTECEEKSPASFHDFLIGDKFCAGGAKTTACQGDSGGGYSVQFPQSKRWYLVGVVSVGPSTKCAEYPYAAFTAVYSNLNFIRDYVYE